MRDQDMITAENVDLSNCDREQVQYCGAIQPYGVLLVIEEASWTIRQVSANSRALLGTDAAELLGRPLHAPLGEDLSQRVRKAVARRQNLTGPPICLMTVPHPRQAEDVHIFAHRNGDGVLMLELEAAADHAPHQLHDVYAELRCTMAEVQATQSIQRFFDTAVSQLRRFTGYDRVLAYKFLEDRSGWVLAEECAPDLERYVGLHYPASDIPEPARRLFSMKWISHLPDVGYQPVPIVSTKTGEPPLDLSYAFLRSVSPMYTGYLKNMGVHSTLVLTLQRHGELWGLISCMHHRGPKRVPFPVRVGAELLAQMLSLDIGTKEALEDRDRVSTMTRCQGQLVDAMRQTTSVQDGLLRHEPNLLSYLGATGALVFIEGDLQTVGEVPDAGPLHDLFTWLVGSVRQHVYATDRLPSVYPPASAYQDQAAGLLALRLFAEKPDFIVWFRPEIERTVHWAGDPHKPVDVSHVGGEARLMPRRSFAVWKETVRGTCATWRDCELAAAEDLRRAIVEVIALRKAEELTRSNDELLRRNRELDAFAYIASHDLKEPLRGVQDYARFVLEDSAHRLDEEGKGRLRTVLHLTGRMMDLINGLLRYARLGREGLMAEPTDVAKAVQQAVQSVRPRLNEAGVTVRIQDGLFVAVINPAMLQEVLVNLLSNAIKYNDKAEKWIEIGTVRPTQASGTAMDALARGHSVLFVKDNGIGIPARHLGIVFDAFRRLHREDLYGGGSGLGLTIARKILERYGGEIWVESEVGVGTTFFFSLPSRMESREGRGDR